MQCCVQQAFHFDKIGKSEWATYGLSNKRPRPAHIGTELIPVHPFTLKEKLYIGLNINFNVQETQGNFSRMHFQLSACYSIFTALTILVVAESIIGIHFRIIMKEICVIFQYLIQILILKSRISNV